MKKYLIILSAIICFNASAKINPNKVPPEIADHPHSANVLIKEFESNSIAATKKYAGKPIQIVGSAVSIYENKDKLPEIKVDGQSIAGNIYLVFKKDDNDVIELQKGDLVVAICDAPEIIDTGLRMKNCEEMGL